MLKFISLEFYQAPSAKRKVWASSILGGALAAAAYTLILGVARGIQLRLSA